MLLSIAATVGMGLSSRPWWLRVLAGADVAVALGIAIKLRRRRPAGTPCR